MRPAVQLASAACPPHLHHRNTHHLVHHHPAPPVAHHPALLAVSYCFRHTATAMRVCRHCIDWSCVQPPTVRSVWKQQRELLTQSTRRPAPPTASCAGQPSSSEPTCGASHCIRHHQPYLVQSGTQVKEAYKTKRPPEDVHQVGRLFLASAQYLQSPPGHHSQHSPLHAARAVVLSAPRDPRDQALSQRCFHRHINGVPADRPSGATAFKVAQARNAMPGTWVVLYLSVKPACALHQLHSTLYDYAQHSTTTVCRTGAGPTAPHHNRKSSRRNKVYYIATAQPTTRPLLDNRCYVVST